MDSSVTIDDRRIGPNEPVYVIAEMSANHNQDLDTAKQLVEKAAWAGADAIKVQTFRPETMTLNSDRDPFRIDAGTEWDDQTLFDLYESAYLSWDWHEPLQEMADDLGMDFFSTAFDSTAVEFLESLDVPVHKTASFEIVDLPLLKTMAKTGKPIIISTGLADLGEIEEAVEACQEVGQDQLILLKCTSSYPAPPKEMNLRTIPNLSEIFGCPSGLSDHSRGLEVPVVATSLGARVIEKHLTLDRDLDTPDSHFSLEPEGFQSMVESVRTAERALGDPQYGPTEAESNNRQFRRSLFVVRKISEGEKFTSENVRSIRPGHGLAPKHYSEILGRTATTTVEMGTPLEWKHVR